MAGFCTNCGKPIKDGWKFCGYCSAPVLHMDSPNEPKAQNNIRVKNDPSSGTNEKHSLERTKKSKATPHASEGIVKFFVQFIVTLALLIGLNGIIIYSVRQKELNVTLLAIFGVILFALLIFCAIKESRTTSTYRQFEVFGRVKAFFFVDFLFAAGYTLVLSFLPEIVIDNYRIPAIFMAGASVLLLAIALAMYFSSRKKSPSMLRDKLFISMLISGAGVTLKIGIFFILAIWKLTTPQFTKMVDENGQELLVSENGDVYDYSGNRVGRMTDGNRYVRF